MSEYLKKKLNDIPRKPESPKVWSLSRTDWKRLEEHLKAAEIITGRARAVTPEEWDNWTSEFSEGQGFPSIIYHDKPMIIRPIGVDK